MRAARYAKVERSLDKGAPRAQLFFFLRAELGVYVSILFGDCEKFLDAMSQ